mgnify:FL=1
MNPPPRRKDPKRGQSYDLMFSIGWKHFFHCVENLQNIFPLCGKKGRFFPRCGKLFSTVWKTLPGVLFAGILTGCSRPVPPPVLPPGQDLSITATMSPNRIRIGDMVDVTLAALHREGTVVAFPNPARGKDIIVRDAQTATEAFPNGVLRTVQQLRLTSMTITNHVIAENAAITVSTPEGLSWTNTYPFLALEVVSALQPGEQEIRPAKGGLARWPAPTSRWLWIVLAVLAGLAAAFLALRKFLTTPRTFLHLPPPLPPHQIALDALAALRQKGWIEALRIEPFYVELSGIVRHYLEDRFGLRAPERTTEEFIRDALASRALSAAHRELVAGFLEQSDLVKFARHAPGQADMRNALDSAERLVRETMPAESVAGKPPFTQEEGA